MPPTYLTRCYICGCALTVTDEYGPWIEEMHNGKLVRRYETRWFDPDWVIAHHIRRNHS